jgi:hypothetical protein
MKRSSWTNARAALIVAALILSQPAQADFEVTGPDGGRFLLKDDGTWRRVGAKDKQPADDQAKDPGEAILRLDSKTDAPGGCRFRLQITNAFPYEIGSIVPSFRAYRTNGVIYETVTVNFNAIKPGNSLYREIQFQGISCQEIARVQVAGGNRCVMGDLDRFSYEEGRCLARVRVVASELVRFEK